MFIKLLKSKLHRARVTGAKLHYPGSIRIDSDLLEAAGILPYEFVLVADIDNGNRLETYTVPAKPGSRQIEILGASAHLIEKNDTVIIMGFGYFTPDEAMGHKPKLIVLDQNNRIVKRSPSPRR